MGSLILEQVDGSGLLYRRSRYYDLLSGPFTQPDPIGLAGGLNLYGYADGDPINYHDPFGLCPQSAGGDGKTEEMSDCPRGSSGWYAHRAATGVGYDWINNAMGVWATLNFDVRAQLPENTAIGEFNVPIGPGRVARLTGETANLRYAIRALGLHRHAVNRDLHAMKRAAGLRGADNVWINTTNGEVRAQATGELIGNLIP